MVLEEEFFSIERFDGERLALEWYDVSHRGVMLLPQCLLPNMRTRILDEIRKNSSLLVRAKDKYGITEQRFCKYYWGTSENGQVDDKNFPLVSACSKAYNTLSSSLVGHASLTQRSVSSTGIHQYWPTNSPGIGPHRDESHIQLVSVITLCGDAPWMVSRDYDGEDTVTFNPSPGSVLLMRGPRNLEEVLLTRKNNPSYNPSRDPRPIHGVGPVRDERVTLLLRHASAKNS